MCAVCQKRNKIFPQSVLIRHSRYKLYKCFRLNPRLYQVTSVSTHGPTIIHLRARVCSSLTCKVHPKTPIMSIAMHRYSEKTSHHGFRTRNFEFCSVPRFLNSPTGIILAAAPEEEEPLRTLRGKTGFRHKWGLWRTSC